MYQGTRGVKEPDLYRWSKGRARWLCFLSPVRRLALPPSPNLPPSTSHLLFSVHPELTNPLRSRRSTASHPRPIAQPQARTTDKATSLLPLLAPRPTPHLATPANSCPSSRAAPLRSLPTANARNIPIPCSLYRRVLQSMLFIDYPLLLLA